jgi:hypothetical protein
LQDVDATTTAVHEIFLLITLQIVQLWGQMVVNLWVEGLDIRHSVHGDHDALLLLGPGAEIEVVDDSRDELREFAGRDLALDTKVTFHQPLRVEKAIFGDSSGYLDGVERTDGGDTTGREILRDDEFVHDWYIPLGCVLW